MSQPKAAFLYVICQHGTENCIKADLVCPTSPLRLAFSRPGLLTFKLPQPEGDPSGGMEAAVNNALVDVRKHWAVRLCGEALGQVSGENADELIQQAFEVAEIESDATPWQALHVFQRDPHKPGFRGFEPGESELARAVGSRMEALASEKLPTANRTADLEERVLDVILIEPNRWLVGWHQATEQRERYPGGVPSIPLPGEMVSRAYLKIAEALIWSQLPLSPSDSVVEIGSAPGGAAQRLLDLGLKVTGIDPGEMDPMVLQHPRFDHWRSKSSGVKRKLFRRFRWLVCDANVAPNYTLEAVEDIVTYETSRFEGLLLTLKLSNYDLSKSFPEYKDRIRSWGFSQVRIRQLANNRSECCAVAIR